jgi:hypothetical protein
MVCKHLLLLAYTNMMYDRMYYNLDNKNQNSKGLLQKNHIVYNYSFMSHIEFKKQDDDNFAIEEVHVEQYLYYE